MRPAKLGLDPKRFAIVLERNLRLPLGYQQVSQKHVGVHEFGISPQGRLKLALRFVEMACPPKDYRIVVPSGGILGPQPKRNFEVIARLREIAGSGKKVAQVAAGVSIVRLNPDGLSKR